MSASTGSWGAAEYDCFAKPHCRCGGEICNMRDHEGPAFEKHLAVLVNSNLTQCSSNYFRSQLLRITDQSKARNYYRYLILYLSNSSIPSGPEAGSSTNHNATISSIHDVLPMWIKALHEKDIKKSHSALFEAVRFVNYSYISKDSDCGVICGLLVTFLQVSWPSELHIKCLAEFILEHRGHPNVSIAWVLLGYVWYRGKEYELARHAFVKAKEKSIYEVHSAVADRAIMVLDSRDNENVFYNPLVELDGEEDIHPLYMPMMIQTLQQAFLNENYEFFDGIAAILPSWMLACSPYLWLILCTREVHKLDSQLAMDIDQLPKNHRPIPFELRDKKYEFLYKTIVKKLNKLLADQFTEPLPEVQHLYVYILMIRALEVLRDVFGVLVNEQLVGLYNDMLPFAEDKLHPEQMAVLLINGLRSYIMEENRQGIKNILRMTSILLPVLLTGGKQIDGSSLSEAFGATGICTTHILGEILRVQTTFARGICDFQVHQYLSAASLFKKSFEYSHRCFMPGLIYSTWSKIRAYKGIQDFMPVKGAEQYIRTMKETLKMTVRHSYEAEMMEYHLQVMSLYLGMSIKTRLVQMTGVKEKILSNALNYSSHLHLKALVDASVTLESLRPGKYPPEQIKKLVTTFLTQLSVCIDAYKSVRTVHVVLLIKLLTLTGRIRYLKALPISAMGLPSQCQLYPDLIVYSTITHVPPLDISGVFKSLPHMHGVINALCRVSSRHPLTEAILQRKYSITSQKKGAKEKEYLANRYKNGDRTRCYFCHFRIALTVLALHGNLYTDAKNVSGACVSDGLNRECQCFAMLQVAVNCNRSNLKSICISQEPTVILVDEMVNQ